MRLSPELRRIAQVEAPGIAARRGFADREKRPAQRDIREDALDEAFGGGKFGRQFGGRSAQLNHPPEGLEELEAADSRAATSGLTAVPGGRLSGRRQIPP